MKMKRFFLWIIASLMVISLTACAVHGYVSERPADVYYGRPAAPGVNYVWIDGDWVWSGGRYNWHEAHWDRRRVGKAWHAGHWSQHGQGWRWEKGHW